MSTPSDRDPAALEPDPTGVRALLAALPDPGPMPPEVTARITASLQQAQEQRQQGHNQHDTPPSGARSAPRRTSRMRTTTVSSLDQRRSRTPHVLAAAASVAAVALAGVVVLDQVVGDGSLGDMAAVYWDGNDSADSAGQAGSAADEAGQGESMAEAGGGADSSGATSQEGQQRAPDSQQDSGAGDALGEAADDAKAAPDRQFEANPPPGDLRVISVSEPMSADTFSVGVSSALTAAGTAPSAPDAGGDSAALSPKTVQPCLDATGEEVATQSWVVSVISLDGDDGVLVVAAGEPNRAWVLAPDCVLGAERAEIRLGPVNVP